MKQSATPLPPIYRDCRRLLVHTEGMVRRFSRYHRYTIGTDLRQSAMALMRCVNQAIHDRPKQIQHVNALVWRVDDYKLNLQLGMDIGAFKGAPPSFHYFEQAANLAAAIGKQCGGWRQALARRQHADQVTGESGNNGPAGAGQTLEPLARARPASLSGCAPSNLLEGQS